MFVYELKLNLKKSIRNIIVKILPTPVRTTTALHAYGFFHNRVIDYLIQLGSVRITCDNRRLQSTNRDHCWSYVEFVIGIVIIGLSFGFIETQPYGINLKHDLQNAENQ